MKMGPRVSTFDLGGGIQEMKRETTPMRGWVLVTALAVGIAALT